jgi:hypothetical protein
MPDRGASSCGAAMNASLAAARIIRRQKTSFSRKQTADIGASHK